MNRGKMSNKSLSYFTVNPLYPYKQELNLSMKYSFEHDDT